MSARLWLWRSLRGIAPVTAILLLCGAANAQWSSGFESPTYTASAAGDDLNGQDGFYNPDPAASVTALTYTYVGNLLGMPPNPGGGDQFVGATGPDGTPAMYVRSQRDISYGSASGLWRVSFDVAATYVGVLPATDNIGSFSTQPLDTVTPANAGILMLARWSDPATATHWNADYIYWPASGSYLYGTVPDAGFQNLPVNHWYRWTTIWDFDTNLIVEVQLTDLTTGDTSTAQPVGWYLSGGSAGLPPPTGFRFFAGSSIAGNTMAFDNLVIEPGCPEDVNGDGTVDVLDLLAVIAAWGNPGGPEDVNGDGVVDVLDLLAVISAWGPC